MSAANCEGHLRRSWSGWQVVATMTAVAQPRQAPLVTSLFYLAAVRRFVAIHVVHGAWSLCVWAWYSSMFIAATDSKLKMTIMMPSSYFDRVLAVD